MQDAKPLGGEVENAAAVVALPAIGDLAAAGVLRDSLVAAIAGGGPVRVTADAVDRLGTACIQILLAADAALAARSGAKSGTLEMTGASAAARQALADAGLAEDFDRWSGAHG